jgi:hypothetical protein
MNKSTYIISVGLVIAAIIGVLFFAHTAAAPGSVQVPAPVIVSTESTTSIPAAAPKAATPSQPKPSTSQAIATSAQVEVIATSTPAPVNSYTIPVTAHETVLDAMYAYASSSSFTFTGRDYPSLGFFVESIGGKQNAGGAYWILYLNGTSSSLGASSALVDPGDRLEWRYEKSY